MARNQAVLNPENTVFEIKRLMGRHWDEASVQEDIRRFPFRVQKLEEGRLGIQIKKKTFTNTFSPEEISAAILSKMKNTAEDFLGMPVTNAVVTVPAYFNNAQRKATMDAGEIAGLNILRIINEPTAAAIAFGYGQKNMKIRKQQKITQNLIIYDLGGGTFDVTVLKLEDNIYKVLSTNGDTHLGGADFDNNIVKYLLGVYNKKYVKKTFFWTGSELKHSLNNGLKEKRAIQKITLEAETTKKALSSRSSMKIDIDSLYEGNDFSEQFSRAQFEKANSDLFDKTTNIVSIALEEANLKISDIDDILLVGGSTKIPKIKSIVKNLFNGKTPVQSLNPDESVAIGAAILGAQLGGEDMESFLLLDVIPHSLGIMICITDTDKCDVFSTIIPKNTPVHEATKSEKYETRYDNQETLPIIVYEGEDPTASKNHKLGKFDLTNIRIAPKGEVGMDVTFDINSDGILHVTAKEVGRENAADITIISYQNRLTRGKIVKAIITEEEFNTHSKEAEQNEFDEEVEIKRQETRETLERIIEKFFKVAKNMGSMTKNFVNEKRRWINANPGATEEEMRKVKKDLFDRMKGEL
eukprot:GFUD01007123.1.p1 GENE.GFUD01007123.1~~GFUD01007123.1.p1  ORF type:complete len:652 (+),score=151.47 GFUD01007123.1:212-1957(+)